MALFKLTEDFKNRFKKFLSSDLFHNQPSNSKTDYWNYHSNEIKYTFKNSILTLEGKSGNYIPDKKNSYQFFSRSIKTFIKQIIGLDTAGSYGTNFMSYKKAFKRIMNEDIIAGYQQVQFDKKKILARDFSDCKKNFVFNYAVNDHIIIAYYYINILNSYIDLTKTKFIIEIGGGNGNLISLLKNHFNSKCIIDVDLPETLILAILFLKDLFPNANILLPNEINNKITKDTLLKYDFIFLTPTQIKLIEENLIDLVINTSSFCEMQKSQVAEYINFIQKVCKKDSFFFTSNNVEKIPFDGEKYPDNYNNIKPIRFFEYPFFDNEILIYQICRLTNFVQHSPAYLRLEKIKK